ncbi:MAG: hypothetical protein H3C27_01395 [Opitutaceae bacterium]|nr:hypothetical protein [Opitutaceae bacterium]
MNNQPADSSAFVHVWPGAPRGSFLPGITLARPPEFYDTVPSDNPPYDWQHHEVALGVWLNGKIALCKYDEETDSCISVDGSHNFSQSIGHPIFYLPLEGAPKVT